MISCCGRFQLHLPFEKSKRQHVAGSNHIPRLNWVKRQPVALSILFALKMAEKATCSTFLHPPLKWLKRQQVQAPERATIATLTDPSSRVTDGIPIPSRIAACSSVSGMNREWKLIRRQAGFFIKGSLTPLNFSPPYIPNLWHLLHYHLTVPKPSIHSPPSTIASDSIMAAHHMTAKIRKALEEYIEDIPTDQLEEFVQVPDTQPGRIVTKYKFASQDFQLAFLGVSPSLQSPRNRRYPHTHTLLPR